MFLATPSTSIVPVAVNIEPLLAAAPTPERYVISILLPASGDLPNTLPSPKVISKNPLGASLNK